MDNSENVFELLFIAIIAGALIYRLYSVLGTRPDNDVKPSAPPVAPAPVVMERQEGPTDASNGEDKMLEEAVQKLENDAPTMDKLKQFRLQFPGFEVVPFLQGAKAAFETITGAFARGDLAAIKDLVSDNVYNSYKEVIEDREKNSQTVEFEIIRFVDARIKDAAIENGSTAKVQVGFTTEQINVLRDSEGKVIQGSDSFINKVQELWSFMRDIKSQDPNWILVAAKSGS